VRKRQDIRKEALSIRRKMDSSELERIGSLIANNVLESDWYRDARCVHCFYGVKVKGEIPTVRIMGDALASGKLLVMPRVTDNDGGMEHVRVTGLELMQPGLWGIPEPVGEARVPVAEIELILVPGLAVDIKGNRMGYGKGYYDRFLETASHSVKAMLVPERFVHDRLPVEDHDVPVDYIVTEDRVLSCGNRFSSAEET